MNPAQIVMRINKMYPFGRSIKIFDEKSKTTKTMPKVTQKCFMDLYEEDILLCAHDTSKICNPDCSACNPANDNGQEAYMCLRGNFMLGHKIDKKAKID